MRVLITGHACCPNAGSEPGLTWNWAWHMADHHEVTLLCHPQFRDQVDATLAEQPKGSLTVRYVTLDPAHDPWKPELGERGIRQHYIKWLRQAFEIARDLHAERRFDLTHHVSWGTVSAPPHLWKLDIPFIWGPTGGGQILPWRFLGSLEGEWKSEAIRNLRLAAAPYWPPIRRAAQSARIVLATNRETTSLLEAAGGRDVRHFFDNGLTQSDLDRLKAFGQTGRGGGDTIRLLWIGRLEPRKALPLALTALAEARAKAAELGTRFTLTIAGDGPSRAAWQALADRMGFGADVTFLGAIQRSRVLDLLHESDALVFSSLQDSAGTVAVEAAAAGLPVITLDHQGVGALLDDDAALKIPVTTPDATTRDLANALIRLAREPELGPRLAANARRLVEAEIWDLRAQRMNRLYQEAVTAPGTAADTRLGQAGHEAG